MVMISVVPSGEVVDDDGRLGVNLCGVLSLARILILLIDFITADGLPHFRPR